VSLFQMVIYWGLVILFVFVWRWEGNALNEKNLLLGIWAMGGFILTLLANIERKL